MNNFKYFYEGKYYKDKIKIHKKLLNQLKAENICKEKNKEISFQFVGLIASRDQIYCILPKHMRRENYNLKIEEQQMIKIVQVLKKYSKSNNINYKDAFFLSKDIKVDNYVSEIALADYIIGDYIKNGLYTKKIKETKLNGRGKIDWKRTINQSNPHHIKKKPVYLDTYNIRKEFEELNVIKRVHEWALSLSIKKFASILGYCKIKTGLSAITSLKSIGSKEFIRSVINKEKSKEYIDRKIELLSALDAFVNKNYYSETNLLSLYGTTAFHYVWEDVCGHYFKNDYDQFVKAIGFPKTTWKDFDGIKEPYDEKPLRPDIIKMRDEMLLIMDAKYYNIIFDGKKIYNYPGASDIVKQIFYEKAVFSTGSYVKKFNVFLFPANNNSSYDIIGSVSYDFLDSRPILLVKLNANEMYTYYIKNNQISDKQLSCFSNLLDVKEKELLNVN